jgi:predicted dehydrogenase
MLRGAVIGLGNVAAGTHLPGWARRPDVVIAGVTDARPDRRAIAEAAGVPWYGSAEVLLAEADLDFVDICTPPSSHGALIRAALDRDLHVLCEKPLVASLGELTALAGLAASSKRVLHTVHNWHHAPIVRRTAELVRAGTIGRVSRVVWQTLRTRPAAAQDGSNWRLDPAVGGGGVLTDHGWHVSYILQSWVGEPPATVSARLETRRHTGFPVEDTAEVHVTFPSATADILLTWAADTRANRAEITGTRGRISLDDDVLVLQQDGGERREKIPPPLSGGSVHPDWFDPVVARFLSDLGSGTADRSNLLEAAVCVALETCARDSSRHGGRAMALAATLASLGWLS